MIQQRFRERERVFGICASHRLPRVVSTLVAKDSKGVGPLGKHAVDEALCLQLCQARGQRPRLYALPSACAFESTANHDNSCRIRLRLEAVASLLPFPPQRSWYLKAQSMLCRKNDAGLGVIEPSAEILPHLDRWHI